MWIDLEEVVGWVRANLEGDWTWVANSHCKYIDIKIDMRDGKAILMDRHGNRISKEKFDYQYSKGDANE